MGRCSYCFDYVSFDRGSECFSLDEARGCFGISGPDDPKRLAAKQRYDAARVIDLRQKAEALSNGALKWNATADAKIAEANRLEEPRS